MVAWLVGSETTIALRRSYGVENSKMHFSASMIPPNTNILELECLFFSIFMCTDQSDNTYLRGSANRGFSLDPHIPP